MIAASYLTWSKLLCYSLSDLFYFSEEFHYQKLNITCLIDFRTGRSKGFAHVDFANDDHAAEAVVELRDIELLGRVLRVDHAAKKSDSMNRNAAPPVSMVRPSQLKLSMYSQQFTLSLESHKLPIFSDVLRQGHQ
jgi:RNA recognition motif-containing protein